MIAIRPISHCDMRHQTVRKQADPWQIAGGLSSYGVIAGSAGHTPVHFLRFELLATLRQLEERDGRSAASLTDFFNGTFFTLKRKGASLRLPRQLAKVRQ